ncbi:NAC domain-containing protein [Musa troglodytarum]|uniref:NAC domain-containing protein n=1 Tax=Musa troglodytarum TaxID=320322 RepID=A0A9E7GKB3_9LILI|nr:NAC domain-containing protein [Musa troglodytarum]
MLWSASDVVHSTLGNHAYVAVRALPWVVGHLKTPPLPPITSLPLLSLFLLADVVAGVGVLAHSPMGWVAFLCSSITNPTSHKKADRDHWMIARWASFRPHRRAVGLDR